MEDVLGFLEVVSDEELDNMSDSELDNLVEGLGRYKRNSPSRYKRGRKKINKARKRRKGKGTGNRSKKKTRVTKNSTSKEVFENKMASYLPENLRKLYDTKKLTTADHVIYGVEFVSSQRVEIFRPGDDKERGVTNLNGSKLPKEHYFLLTAIQILGGVHASADTDDAGKSVDFGEIHTVVANGEFELKVADKIYFHDCGNRVFKHGVVGNLDKGIFNLENPKLIEPEANIELNVELSADAPPHYFLKANLIGMILRKS